jgi:hypothetical protein
MSRIATTRDAWHPRSKQDRDAVLFELQEVLASPHFCNSRRYPALLQYIVEKTLAGKAELLKERTLGVEVFDRPPSYDTNADTVVRYTAGEVRKRLSLYYHEHGSSSSIRISLPAGSYIPEFEYWHEPGTEGHAALSHWGAELPVRRTLPLEAGARAGALWGGVSRRRVMWLVATVMLVLALAAGARWRYSSLHPQSALDAFWVPVLRDQRMALICTGGSSFAQNNFSGVITAGKDVDYPFVSIQIASAIAQLSGLMEQDGATTQLDSAASTPLTELREHPVILLGGYNNQWTLRLLQPLRFHFSPEVDASIVDQTQPQVRWARDHSLPYSSADDYAVVARYRDATTDGWVIVLAGLGRNGTEAAAQFATSPHYLQLLRERIGSDFANRNVEAVLKVNVIEGKTGAPAILATHVW